MLTFDENHNSIKWNQFHSSDSSDRAFDESAAHRMTGGQTESLRGEKRGLEPTAELFTTFPTALIGHANFVRTVTKICHHTFYETYFPPLPSSFFFKRPTPLL